jgi:hypothetical protein
VRDEQALTWQQIRQTWPESGQVDAHIAAVLQMAQKRGLVAEQGDYQYRSEPELNALKVTMNLPLRGTYNNLRGWVDAVLREHPNLKVRWVGWYRAEEAQVGTSGSNPQATAPTPSPAVAHAVIPASSEVRR